MTTKRKYNVTITNWNDSTVEFLNSVGYEALPASDNRREYLLASVSNNFTDIDKKHLYPLDIECDWLTEPDLVKALVCETDDYIFREHTVHYDKIHNRIEETWVWLDGCILKEENVRKATLQEVLDYFRKNKKVVEPVGVEDRKKAEINPKRMTRREFYEAISNPNEAYKQHLKMLWDNNDAKSIFEITGLNVAGMLNAKNNDIIEGKTKAKTEEKPKREPDGYICPIDIHELDIKKGDVMTLSTKNIHYRSESGGYIVPSIVKTFFTPIYEQTIEEKIIGIAEKNGVKIPVGSCNDFVNEVKELFNDKNK